MRAYIGLAAVGIAASAANADVVVPLLAPFTEHNVNGALYRTSDFSSAGSGVIDSFVRLRANGTEEGYNTPNPPAGHDNNGGPGFNRDLLLSEVPIVQVAGIRYYEFLLDINQSTNDSLLTLDDVQIWTLMAAPAPNAPISAFGTPTYRLDTAATDYRVELDYALGAGSGQGDMQLLVPESTLGIDLTKHIVLYSLFGSVNDTNDGFEEWAVGEQMVIVPLPPAATAGLSSLGLVGGIAIARRRRNARN
jgi:hypothetical protein